MNLKRPLYGPQDPRGPSRGRDVRDFVKRTLHRMPAQTGFGENFFPKPEKGFSDVYNEKTAAAIKTVQRFWDIEPTGNMGQATFDVLWDYADGYSKWSYRLYVPPKDKPQWENIGPVQPGGTSLLDMSLTHATSGIPLFPAIDTAWGGGGGVVVIAPEDCVVDTKDTSSAPGEAFFLTGVSKLRYWFGHLDRDWPLGRRFAKGDVIGRTLAIPGKSDHAHCGVNAEALLGKGRQLEYGRDGNGPDYTLGAPTIREQLRRGG